LINASYTYQNTEQSESTTQTGDKNTTEKSEYTTSETESEKNINKTVDKIQISEQNNNYKININTADESELTTLPGIGDKKAETIIAYRDENGEFKSVEDIMNVKGIGEKLFDGIKDLITV
jgi:competence protein ComEA